MMATWRACRGPVILVFVLQLLTALAIFFGPIIGSLIPQPWALALFAFAGIYLLDLWAMAWLGMWCTTVVKDFRRTAGVALQRCVILPGLIFAILACLWRTVTFLLDVDYIPPGWIIIASWFLIGILNDVFWIAFIKRNLPGQIRRFSMRRYTQPADTSDISRIVLWTLNTLFRRKHAV
jgi:hypothetical protein